MKMKITALLSIILIGLLTNNVFVAKTKIPSLDSKETTTLPSFTNHPNKNFALRIQNNDIDMVQAKIKVDGNVIFDESIEHNGSKDIFLNLKPGRHTLTVESSSPNFSNISPAIKEFVFEDSLRGSVVFHYVKDKHVFLPWQIFVHFENEKQ